VIAKESLPYMAEKKKPSRANMPNIYGTAGGPYPHAKKSRKRHQDDVDTWRAALSGQILAQSSPSGASMRESWLNCLKFESLQFLESYGGGQLEKIRQEQFNKQAIEVTVDRLFSCLQGFAYEFNKIAVGTELHVSGTMSGDVKEVLHFNRYREAEQTQTYFRARLSTRLYALIIRGGVELIDCFLMPVNHAMALSRVEKEYNPLITIEIKVNEEGIVWRSLADGSSFNSLEDLCAWLFQSLIDQTRGAISARSRDDG
jgi:hypothetical protein